MGIKECAQIDEDSLSVPFRGFRVHRYNASYNVNSDASCDASYNVNCDAGCDASYSVNCDASCDVNYV